MQLYYAIQRIFIKSATASHKFPNKYIDVIFIQIDEHLKMLLKKYKGVQILLNTVYTINRNLKPEKMNRWKSKENLV